MHAILHSYISNTHTHTLTHMHALTHTCMYLHTHTQTAIGNYGTALECYLHAGAISSQFFETEVPTSTWTQTVYRRIIKCCTKLGYNTHAAIFSQFLQPVDYELAFEILNSSISTTVESLFAHFWDMTIIEYLICILKKITVVIIFTPPSPTF